MAIYISPRIRAKLLEKHGVSEEQIHQCFMNVTGNYLQDTREEHATDPPTHWFISETNRGRLLKVVFVARKVNTLKGEETRIDIKTAYPPNSTEIGIYEKHGYC